MYKKLGKQKLILIYLEYISYCIYFIIHILGSRLECEYAEISFETSIIKLCDI